ncbi:TetR/AcrR family transcriptional regulator [Paenibacillus anaericanus]|uniref:TetR/AcrR family transcriptional regulator n=1 Tax=Paenibacillus anaericanus TaxID=170367 RepID=A0A433Y7J8_9BACL|nr:TetR/AcrR family transcriptional regulator [Paenibacillus anaericanus]RUT45339.1 TetR/AcrR family transcriptional regulator [Paenibacillus anaericanus]
MGIHDRKEKEKEIRRNDIIDAAERIFFTKGYDHATMDDVAKEAEFSKRTVYVYFNSKEQIYFEIMTRGYKLLIAMLKTDAPKENANHAIAELEQMSLTLYRFSMEHPEYFSAIMEYENGELDFQKGVPVQSQEDCYALGEELLGHLTGALEKGIAEGTIRGELDVVQTALVLWACMIGVFNIAKKKEKYIKNYHRTEPEELLSAAFQLITRSIQTESGGSLR